jgi:hypothetical protein
MEDSNLLSGIVTHLRDGSDPILLFERAERRTLLGGQCLPRSYMSTISRSCSLRDATIKLFLLTYKAHYLTALQAII